MICRYCNAENKDDAKFCNVCGRRLDGNVLCPSCGKITSEGKFCSYCGLPLTLQKKCMKCGTIFDGERCPVCFGDLGEARDVSIPSESRTVRMKRCTKCGTVFDGDSCPVCSAASAKGGKTREDRASFVNPYNLGGFTSNVRVSAEAKNAVDRVYRGKRRVYLAFAIVGFLGVLAALAFTFFTGWKTTLEIGNDRFSSEYRLYYFFHDAYSGIEGSAERAYAVMGTVVSGAMMLVMTAMSVICAVRFAMSLRNGNQRAFVKCVITTYLLYVSFLLMFRSLADAASADYALAVKGGTFKIFTYGRTFNWEVVVGLTVAGTLSAVSYAGISVLSFRRSPKIGVFRRYILPLIAVAALILSVLFFSNIIIRYEEGFDANDMSYSLKFGEGYLQYAVATDEEKLSSYGLMAVIATCFYAAAAMLAAAKLMTHVYAPEEKNSILAELALSIVAAVVAVLFAVLIARYLSLENPLDLAENLRTELTWLYVAGGTGVVSIVLCIVHMAIYPREKDEI